MAKKTKTARKPKLNSKPHVLVLEAPYYAAICEELVQGAVAAITKAGGTWERLSVPGALELPAAVNFAAQSKKYHAFVVLGCVMKGETIHYEIVGFESARAIMDLTLKGLCIGNGVLTVESEEQAWARARREGQDIGGNAARAALAMLEVSRRFSHRGGTGK